MPIPPMNPVIRDYLLATEESCRRSRRRRQKLQLVKNVVDLCVVSNDILFLHAKIRVDRKRILFGSSRSGKTVTR